MSRHGLRTGLTPLTTDRGPRARGALPERLHAHRGVPSETQHWLVRPDPSA